MKLFEYLNKKHESIINACRDNEHFCKSFYKTRQVDCICCWVFLTIIVSLFFVLSAVVGIYCGWSL